MTVHHFNTTRETGARLAEYERKAETQEEIILAWFESRPRAYYTPSFVWRQVLPNRPIQSVRRAITNLTDAGKLVKTDLKDTGLWGRPEYCWRLAEIDPYQPDLLAA